MLTPYWPVRTGGTVQKSGSRGVPEWLGMFIMKYKPHDKIESDSPCRSVGVVHIVFTSFTNDAYWKKHEKL